MCVVLGSCVLIYRHTWIKLLIQDIMTSEQTKKFKYWQTRTIVVTMIGYALYYFVRKNFNTAMPSIEATFGITKAQLGLFLTLNGIIYGLSRFINGFIADRVSARRSCLWDLHSVR